MKTYGGEDRNLQPSFTLGLDRGDWPVEKVSCTPGIGGWVGPRVGLLGVKLKISRPYREPNPDSSVVQHAD
jgi:hypothetical protein